MQHDTEMLGRRVLHFPEKTEVLPLSQSAYQCMCSITSRTDETKVNINYFQNMLNITDENTVNLVGLASIISYVLSYK